jgi:D-inositol-3-phosphate glycosyltransferase
MTYLQHNQALRLLIIGGDGHNKPDSQEIQRLANEMGVQNAVTFAGSVKQEDLPPYYSAADVLVVPSYHESFGLVALESLACGTPVVATKVGAMGLIVREGETGCVLTNATPRLLANRIWNFASKAQNEMRTADLIRSSILRYSWSNVADALVEEFRAVIRRWNFSNIRNLSPRALHY